MHVVEKHWFSLPGSAAQAGVTGTPHGAVNTTAHTGRARKPATVSGRLHAPASTLMPILPRLARPLRHAGAYPMIRIKRNKLSLGEFKSAINPAVKAEREIRFCIIRNSRRCRHGGYVMLEIPVAAQRDGICSGSGTSPA
ncbi:MAG: hypothetical protein ACJ8G3_10110 [Burkholderiaceae bacterium]